MDDQHCKILLLKLGLLFFRLLAFCAGAQNSWDKFGYVLKNGGGCTTNDPVSVTPSDINRFLGQGQTRYTTILLARIFCNKPTGEGEVIFKTMCKNGQKIGTKRHECEKVIPNENGIHAEEFLCMKIKREKNIMKQLIQTRKFSHCSFWMVINNSPCAKKCTGNDGAMTKIELDLQNMLSGIELNIAFANYYPALKFKNLPDLTGECETQGNTNNAKGEILKALRNLQAKRYNLVVCNFDELWIADYIKYSKEYAMNKGIPLEKIEKEVFSLTRQRMEQSHCECKEMNNYLFLAGIRLTKTNDCLFDFDPSQTTNRKRQRVGITDNLSKRQKTAPLLHKNIQRENVGFFCSND